jgi:hypothetical protein
MVAALGKDAESGEELFPSGHAWKSPMPAVWPTAVGEGVSSKVHAGGQKGVIRTKKHGQFGSTLLDVRNRENYIPVRAKEERKKQMGRWEAKTESESKERL